MTTDQIVYLMIAILAFITCIMMIMILWIGHIETKNSKRHLSLKLMMHYHTKFHSMLTTLERYQIKDVLDCVEMYQKYQPSFSNAVKDISFEISDNCVNNRFVFAHKILQEELKYKSKQLVENFQDWTDILKKMDDAFDLQRKQKLEDTQYLESLWESHFLKYDKMKALVIEMNVLINNDAILEVIR